MKVSQWSVELLCVDPIYPQYSGVLETCVALGYWFFEVLGSESVNTSTDCHLTTSGNGKHVTQVAEGSYHLQLIRSYLNQALSSLPSIVPLHNAPLLSRLFAVDAVVAHSCTTDIALEPTWTLQEVQTCTAHHAHLPSTPSPPCLFLYQEPPDIFLQRFSNDNKMICIDIIQGSPRA